MNVPRVSVIVPTYNRTAAAGACAAALLAQDYPPGRCEIILVNDGGDVPRLPTNPRVRLVDAPHGGPAAARNFGARLAGGELLAFTDDDCRPAAGWLSALVRAIGSEPDVMAGGTVANALRDNPLAEASAVLLSYLYDYMRAHAPALHFFASNNLAAPTERFRLLGGFDERYPAAAGEDRDLSERWQTAGGRLRFAPDAVVWHHSDLTASGFWRQHARYGRAAYRFHAGRSLRAGAGPKVLGPGFYAGLLLRPFRGRSVREAAPLAALLALSQAANAAGFLAEALEQRRDR